VSGHDHVVPARTAGFELCLQILAVALDPLVVPGERGAFALTA
jgi:hypothetical protein